MSFEAFDLSIPSETAQGQAVQERIVGILEQMGYSQKDVFGVKLALEEALVNAIKHGNGMDPNKSVQVSCRVSQEEARITITDEGPGFDPEEVPDPTDDENLEKPGGRGIMLMRAFMSEVEFAQNGNQVLLVKIREHEAEESSSKVAD
jgi:serine/threonine-protein kinase RsbW